ncbi:MAG TPA: DUF1992 domain-containing protein [Streptosporangiaceae bacterium]|nr:DUF1992 domain-containing protein [Streptosporangiaceae bacterium]
MTERKPPEISFASWIDQQINEAAERGAFDNLPGAGKPLPVRPETYDYGLAWVQEHLRKDGVPVEEILPPPLKLRKQSARLAEQVADLAGEQEVRDAVADLNRRIMEWRRIPEGPPIFVPLVDEEAMVARWRDAHPAPPADPGPAAAPPGPARRRRWRRTIKPGSQAR